MHFPRFWARGASGAFVCWRWSDSNSEDAESQARDAAAQLARRFQAEGRLVQRYGYSDRPLREPVLREIRDASGNTAAVITRNSYGCQILNTARAMFVDVDLEESGVPLEAALARAGYWAKTHPGWGWRVYRTAAGLRLLATHAPFDPKDGLCQSVFEATGADPLYRRLCSVQECFRARLTPKPWRCGVSNPPARWPFPDDGAERRYQSWEEEYRSKSYGKVTCQLVNTFGSPDVHPDIAPLVSIHDDMTAVGRPGKLA